MGIRKAFVNWQKFGPDSDPENKKLYMVCAAMEGDACSLHYAHYYDKGTVVELKVDDMYKIAGDEPTAEERLMRCIFGNHKAFVIPEDGFYLITGDFGIDEEAYNGAFEGCREQAVCLGARDGWSDESEDALPVYWAELPVLPDGRTYFGLSKAWMGRRREAVSDEMDALYDRVQAHGTMKACYDSMCKGAVPGDAPIDKNVGEAVYSVTPYKIADLIEGVHNVAAAVAKIQDQFFIDLHEAISGKPLDEARSMIESFLEDCQVPARFQWMAVLYSCLVRDDLHDFYYYRDKRLADGGLRSLNVPAVLQEAWGMSSLPYRFGRYVTLLRIGAPEIILANELRLCVERVIAAKMGQNLVHVLPGFDTLFGVKPDGSRGEVHCECGDKELQLMPEDDPDGDPGCGPDDGDGGAWPDDAPCPGPEERPCRKEPVIGVDVPFFAVIQAPNFLMRKCRFVLWDNTDAAYLRDDAGSIEQFQDWRTAKSRSEELAAAMKADKA